MKKVVTLGEILIRFSTKPGELLAQADSLAVHYGGAEANVAVSLANLGFESKLISKIPANPLGAAASRKLRSHGVGTEFLIEGGERLGTYYLESGAGERSAQVTYDRKHSSFTELTAEEIDLDLALTGADLFHVTGITLALSEEMREFSLAALKRAKELGVKTSFDFNYRSKLWSLEEARAAFLPLLPYVDICSCGELDAVHLLGFMKSTSNSASDRLWDYYRQLSELYPNIRFISSTFRTIHSATDNELQGNLYTNGRLYQSKIHRLNPIIDRVGGGDAFAAGVLAGILEDWDPQETINFATAASALKHTVFGDASPFSMEEVRQFAGSEAGKIVR